eukprot:Hpha_TRINITY_DN16502_c0_g2::TRINITY_DN16502_c0_g2_i1::g.135836::m.135836/K17914/KIF13; kinesin family member 13
MPAKKGGKKKGGTKSALSDDAIRAVYALFDTGDGSAAVDVAQLAEVMRSELGSEAAEADAQAIVDEITKEHSGHVGFDDFKKIICRGGGSPETSPRRASVNPLAGASLDPATQERFLKEQQEGKKKETVRVMVRVRPFMPYEKKRAEAKGLAMDPVCYMVGKECQIKKTDGGKVMDEVADSYKFDECFWSIPKDQEPLGPDLSGQNEVFNATGIPAVNHAFAGYNTCIFAYGQTGSGKTHSMLGNDADPGIAPRLVDLLFSKIKECAANGEKTKFTVSIAFMEIYNEKVMDLMMHEEVAASPAASPRSAPADEGDEGDESGSPLASPKSAGSPKKKKGKKKAKKPGPADDDAKYRECKVRYSPDKGTYVDGITRLVVTTSEETMRCMHGGMSYRATACHDLNATSSRSHAIFQLTLKQDTVFGTTRVSSMNIVDLAGSERQKATGSAGSVLNEAKNINQSLSTLRRVMDVLVENSKFRRNNVPPFRESMLTWVLKDSLGGNSKTVMLAAISPHISNLDDTINTLRYALKAKAIVLHATVNEEKTATMMGAMKAEIEALQRKLLEGAGTGASDPEAVQREVEAQIKEKQKEFEEAQVQAEELKKEMAVQAEQAQVREKELEVQAKEEKKTRFAAVFRQAFRVETKRVEQEGKVQQLTEQLERAHAQTERLREEAEEKEVSSKSRISLLESELENVTNREKQASDQVADLMRIKREQDQKIAREERKVLDLQDQHTKLSSLGKDEVQHLQKELLQLKTAERDKERLQQDFAELRARSEQIAIARSKAEAGVAKLEEHVHSILREKEELTAAHEETKKMSLSRWEEIGRLRQEIEAKGRAGEREAVHRDERIAELKEECQSLREEVQIERKQREDVENDCSQLRERSLRHRFDVVHQANDLEEARGRIAQLEAETQDLRQQLAIAQSQLSRREAAPEAAPSAAPGSPHTSPPRQDLRDYLSTRFWAPGKARAEDMRQDSGPSNGGKRGVSPPSSARGDTRVWVGRGGYHYPSGSPHRQQRAGPNAGSPPPRQPTTSRRTSSPGVSSRNRVASREAGARRRQQPTR